MGWMFYTDPAKVAGYAGEKDEITRLTTHVTETCQYRPLQISKVGSTWYAAVERRPRDGKSCDQTTYQTAADGSYVFAVVVLVRYHDHCFGYKDMDETMGPNEARAPITLIRKLSPIVDPESYAHAWRHRCTEFANIPTYAAGDIIDLGTPIKLTDGSEITTVKKKSYFDKGKNRTAYVDTATGQTWRLKREHLAGSTLRERDIHAATDVLAEFARRQGALGI